MAVDIIDFFKADGYSMISLTQEMLKIPYMSGRLQSLFVGEGIGTATALIEIRDQVVSILPTSARGSSTPVKSTPEAHNQVTIKVPHIETADSISADSLFGYREFGSAEPASPNLAIARKMKQLKDNLSYTWEWHAAGAIFTGQVLDADNSVLVNLNTKFGITRSEVAFHLDTTTTDVRSKCVAVTRVIRDALKGVPYTGVTALCSRGFWDSITGHADVKETFKYQEGIALRANLDFQKFVYGGVSFELYDQGDPATLLAADTAVAIPEGLANNYQAIYAPSDRMESQGTLGVPSYVWQGIMEDQKGLKITAQTNPAFVVRRGDAIVTLKKIS